MTRYDSIPIFQIKTWRGKVFCDKSLVEVGWGGGGRGEMAAQRRILPLIILLAAQLATGETS